MVTLETVYLRASVASVCNLNCVYCPKQSGMEDRKPARLQKRTLSLTEYVDCLKEVAAAGIRRVSFTGGEPTTNDRLPEIVAAASEIFEVIELTSNGHALPRMLPHMAEHLDLIKVSLDSMNRETSARLARGPRHTLDMAVTAIRSSVLHGVKVAVNFVLMRSNEPDLEELIHFVRSINAEYGSSVYVSVLDFYYSDEQRKTWEKEYTPIARVEARLRQRYGNVREQVRFGCRFVWINCRGVEVRLKDSGGATMRADICSGCADYCQEGLYGLKLSMVGWLTTCPSNDERLGSDLYASRQPGAAQEAVGHLLERLRRAVPDSDTFFKLLRAHNLSPAFLDQ